MTRAREPGDGGRGMAVVAPNWLGDAVMSLSAIAALGNKRGVAVLARPYTARVFWNAPGVSDVWIDPPGGRIRRIRARAGSLRAYGADAAVILPPSFSGALAPYLAGVSVRVGFATGGRMPLLSDAVALPPRTRHLTMSYLDLAARALGHDVEESPARLTVSAADRAAAVGRLNAAGVRGAFALVVPGAAFGPAKAWPWERYQSLCRALAAELPVVLSGGSGDRDVCARIAAGITGVVDVCGRTGLGEFFALAERASVLVANDSGAPHVSAALGTPTVVLFGSTSPAWTAPRGPAVRVLQHVVHCNPCFGRTCPTALECFNGIAVEDVLTAARQSLDPPVTG
ncbi:MAG TPA: lipopolysaccharide heptosyltransferase II [Candidatus Krumholzibacteria bacterium]|nr:lipopolysaccharide heptosyltransferase II [Candidatus Krumholzibacteria bacterium]